MINAANKLERFTQQPTEAKRYRVSFVRDVSAAETITNPTFEITPTTDPPLLTSAVVIAADGKSVSFLVAGGLHLNSYRVTTRVTTSLGQTLEDEMIIAVLEVGVPAPDPSSGLPSHTHSIANVTGLQTVLDAKAPLVHTHPASSVTDGQTLARSNDTNVTLTLSGGPETALLTPVTVTAGWSGQLAVSRGGTGVATLTGLVQGNGASALTTIANSSTTGQLLRVTGGSTYGWGALDLANASAVTGVLPDANLSSNIPLKNVSNVFTGSNQTVSATVPKWRLIENDQPADEKHWESIVNGGNWQLRTRNDADNGGALAIDIDRTGTTVGAHNYTGTSFTFNNKVDAPTFELSNRYTVSTREYAGLSTAAPQALLDHSGATFDVAKAYRVMGAVIATGTHTGSSAIFFRDGGAWEMIKSYERGVHSNHIEFFLNAGVPSIRLWNHAGPYTARVVTEEISAQGSNGAAVWGHSGFREILDVPYFGANQMQLVIAQTAAESTAGVTPTNLRYRPGDIRRYGAVGDGSTNDATAIQNALNVEQDVYIPATTTHYRVTSVLNVIHVGQSVYGDGPLSKVVQTGTNMSTFSCVSKGQNQFRNIWAVPTATAGGGVQVGYGFYISGSNYCTVENCMVNAHQRGGVAIVNSNYCQVVNNHIFDSTVVGTEAQSATGYDIYLGGTSSYNTVRGNHCINGCGVGIALQTILNTDAMRGNVIEGNVIKDQDAYGIMTYLVFDTGSDVIEHTVIKGNSVTNVTGSIDIGGVNLFYGAGIYLQSSEHNTVVGNFVKNTNSSRSLPFSASAVPAAIALSGRYPNSVISANMIEDCYIGITSIQATAPSPSVGGRGTIITDNTIRNADWDGIQLLETVSAQVCNNRIHFSSGTPARNGIILDQVSLSQSDDFIIHGNRIEGFESGITTDGTINRVICTDNIIRGNTSFGILLTATYSGCRGNVIVQAAGGDGIGIGSAATDGFCTENYVTGGDYGIGAPNGAVLYDRNILRSNSTAAVNGGVFVALANSATPSVRNLKFCQINNTTTITDFTNEYAGQELVIRSTVVVTITNNANIQLNGAANYVMGNTDTLTLVSDGTTWQEVARSNN
jgi:parallel beta-helix repeat protein